MRGPLVESGDQARQRDLQRDTRLAVAKSCLTYSRAHVAGPGTARDVSSFGVGEERRWRCPRVGPLTRQWVAAHSEHEDRVASYLTHSFALSASWRFYLGRTPQVLAGWGEIGRFFSAPGRAYCAMEGEHYDFLRAARLPIRIAYERDALLTTTHLRPADLETMRWRRYVIATNAEP